MSHSPAFRTGLSSLKRGEILVPAIRAALADPRMNFKLEISGMGSRAPDFWFHPSQHPNHNERSLYLWMTDPSLLDSEMRDPMSTLSLVAGTIWHTILQDIMMELKLIEDVEVAYEHPETRSRGKIDGLRGDEIIEIKTMKDIRIAAIKSAQDYIEMYPTYAAQAYEYMRLSGLRKERVLLMALTYPFVMKEFVIEFDQAASDKVQAKYESVLQAVADRRMPMCDGCRPNTFCPSRSVCSG